MSIPRRFITRDLIGMRIVGLLLMVAGWLIVLTAVIVLASGPAQVLFILVSIGIELTGFVLLTRYHLSLKGESFRGDKVDRA